ncbi:MAG TPA: phosphoribosylformylglycinamidine cyclo-ligase [Thermoplasmata archaeon]|nr:phosphoribosylformylglycinamidine cyclo-ligase [Thermoplasmata archaeon]
MAGNPSGPWTYARSGVDRSEVRTSLQRLLEGVRYHPPPAHGRMVRLPGHYAGIVRIGRETIAITTDTVGTKSLLAEAMGSWEEVGEDVVAVNANDLASVGARPSVLVDCLSVPRPDPEIFAAIGRGIDRGLRAARMHLAGGETAVVPDLVGHYDLGGTAVGFFPAGRRPVTGAAIRPGDVVLGIPSSGVHANGLTLLRRLISERSVDLRSPRPGATEPVGLEILRATRMYTQLADAVAGRPEVHGFAHISGGGVRNLVRLRPQVAFVLDRWPAPAGLFRWIAGLGELAADELYQTFNMGIGFVVIARPSRRSELLRRLARAGAPDAIEVGHVERGTGVRLPHLGLEFEGY